MMADVLGKTCFSATIAQAIQQAVIAEDRLTAVTFLCATQGTAEMIKLPDAGSDCVTPEGFSPAGTGYKSGLPDVGWTY